MMIDLLLLFIVANIINVIVQTVKSIATVKANKEVAALINAFAYGFYTYILVLTTTDDLPLFAKALIVGLCNLIGVYLVKWLEEKNAKEKLWSLQITLPFGNQQIFHNDLDFKDIPHNYIPVGKYSIFHCYCYTKEQTKEVLKMAETYGGKTFASESILH